MSAPVGSLPKPQTFILVVEDNESLSRTLGMVLKRFGYIPGFAFNGQEAVANFRTRTFSLIFMDVNMPVMNGLEATRQIRTLEGPIGPRIPIVGYTACRDEYNIDCLEAGMNECLEKPSSSDAIKQVIDKYLSNNAEHTK